MTEDELAKEFDINRLRRKRDQAYELAGLARRDGDEADVQRHTETAQRIQKRIVVLAMR